MKGSGGFIFLADLGFPTITLNTLRTKKKRSRGFCADVWWVICEFIYSGWDISE